MTDLAEAKRQLEALRGVFVERFGLKPPYDSAGVAAIEAAIEAGAKADLVQLRDVVFGYNLYAHHEALAESAIAAAEEALVDEPGDT